MSKKGKLGSFLGGALVGAGLGILFAPKSGSETRKALAEEISVLWDKIRGMDIIFVTTAKTDAEAKELLSLLGMPFKN